MDTYDDYTLHAGRLIGICLKRGYDLTVRRLEPEPRLVTHIEMDLVIEIIIPSNRMVIARIP